MMHTIYPLSFIRAKLISEALWSVDLDLKTMAECIGNDVVETMANYKTERPFSTVC